MYGVDDALLNALAPLIKGLTSPNSSSLLHVAETLAQQLGKTVTVDTVLQGLRAHSRMKTPFAQTAMSLAETAVATAERAAIAAGEQLAAKGAEQAAINAARQAAREAVLRQGVRQVATRGVAATVASVLAGMSGLFWILLVLGIAGIAVTGVIMSQGDKPIEPGPAMSGPRPGRPADQPQEMPATARVNGAAFVLVDVKEEISIGPSLWELDGKGGTATFVASSEVTADYKWNVPDRIGRNGADISYSCTATAGKNSRMAASISVSGEGVQFDLDRDSRGAYALAEAEETKSDSKQVHVTAPDTAEEVVLYVSIQYDVSVKYTFRREDAGAN
jgi:hypothetical protein